MKLLTLAFAVFTCVIAAPQTPPLPGVDIPGALIGSFSEVTRQINSIQSVLNELNGHLARMLETSTRMITGRLNSESSPSVPSIPSIPGVPGFQGNPANGLIGTAFQTVQQLTGQLMQVQRSIQEITGQLERVVQTSTRIITGPNFYADGNNSLPSAPNFAETALKTLQEWTNSLQGMNQVLREMNEQWNRVVATGSRMVTGKLQAGAGGLTLPGADIVNSAFNGIRQQISQLQRVLNDFSIQLTRMLESGTRLVSGLNAEGTSPIGSSPGDSALAVVNALTQQFSQVQRVLSELNGQLNRMIETSTRMLG